jgi:hypothetical protein
MALNHHLSTFLKGQGIFLLQPVQTVPLANFILVRTVFCYKILFPDLNQHFYSGSEMH